MAFINMICPNCGGKAQLEAGRSAMCPYCARELNAPEGEGGFAFAPPPEQEFLRDVQLAEADMQFAEPDFAQPDIQFAQPPVQMQAAPPQTAQYMYPPQQLAEAQGKRRNWYLINSAMITAQTLMFALGILFTVKGYRIGVPLILTWVLTLFGFGAVSGLTRPEEAYIDKKPFSKNKFLAGITQLWLGAAISSAVGGILFAIFAGLLGMY